eukprot:TRINITY_DN1841_c0_g2_i1.p1 TRINITY_DN1841_c0_g2~~TRINITY_DN1841_c0_g2_i1.p1  ORF type:complete len:266 (-),score=41.15 TRINITY_DN1841_c0_g2_i1:170-967(-)
MIAKPPEGCSVTDVSGWIVQIILGLICLGVLICKRYQEKPRRLWKIWLLDTSKQIVSALAAHMLNVVLAVVLTSIQDSHKHTADACAWYFVTIIFDTTLGTFICYLMLKYLNQFFIAKRIDHLASGNYFKVHENTLPQQSSLGKPNRKVEIDYGIWFAQLLIWIMIVILSKIFLYLIQYYLSGFFINITLFLFQGLRNLPFVKLLLVMILIPTIMNALQFWLQDNFLKKKTDDHEDIMVKQLFFEDTGAIELSKVSYVPDHSHGT